MAEAWSEGCVLSGGGMTVLEMFLCKLAGPYSCPTTRFLVPGPIELIQALVSRESNGEYYNSE